MQRKLQKYLAFILICIILLTFYNWTKKQLPTEEHIDAAGSKNDFTKIHAANPKSDLKNASSKNHDGKPVNLLLNRKKEFNIIPQNIASKRDNEKPKRSSRKRDDVFRTNSDLKIVSPKIQAEKSVRSDRRPNDDTLKTKPDRKTSLSKTERKQVRLTRKEADDILRQSVEMIHQNNFNKPPNETCMKRLPSAIVIGVEKSGTRELVDFLHLHPHIQIYFTEKCYEMPYFSSKYKNGVEWLREEMPCSYSNQITVMKHSAYFHIKAVPERIQKLNESIKLILIVREPISRAYSAYSFFSGKSKHGKSFSDSVIDDENKIKKQQRYVKRSAYDSSMKLWLTYFNLSQILIIESSDFKQNPVSVLENIEQFLGLSPYVTSDMFTYNGEKGFYCISSNLTSTSMACYASNRGRVQETIPQETMSKLIEYFKPRNKRFFNLIGRSFDW